MATSRTPCVHPLTKFVDAPQRAAEKVYRLRKALDDVESANRLVRDAQQASDFAAVDEDGRSYRCLRRARGTLHPRF
jgi:hypothetical protein